MLKALRQKGNNLRTKLIRVFLLQIVLISLLVVGGVYAARFIVKDVLIHRALEGEAAFFWARYAEDPQQPLPETLNLTGYLSIKGHPAQGVPEAFRGLQPGMHRVSFAGQEPIVYVSDRLDHRLYLVFDEKSVSRLALLFGLLPLAFVLVFFYLFAWVAYRQSSKAVSPLVQLADQVDAMNFRTGKWAPLDVGNFDMAHNLEAHSMVTAINHFIERLHQFVEREREFTRDASHELRTPIAVLKGALEVLERRHPELSDPAITRMQRTLRDMQELTETLLLLARDESGSLPSRDVDMSALVRDKLDALTLLHGEKPLQVDIIDEGSLSVRAPEKVLEVLVGNLLGNAFNYTSRGTVRIILREGSMDVIDSGIGMKKEQIQAATRPFYRATDSLNVPGHGLGMAIVQRLCNRYQWHLAINSAYGEGTRIRIRFHE